MKLLLLAVTLAVAAGVALFAFEPQPGVDTEALALQVSRLERELADLRARPPSPPTYDHWKRFERYLDTYESLALERLPPDKVGRPEFGGEQWGGVMSGPALDLFMAASIVQTLVPVYFDRVAVEDDAARMTFYVLGAREN